MADSKYNEKRPSEFIKLMADGKSIKQVAAQMEVSPNTFLAWRDAHPEFKEAYAIGKIMGEAYWEDLGQKGIKGIIKFNAAAWMYYMKVRFREDWTETTEQKIELVDSIKKMSDAELDKVLLERMTARAKKISESKNLCQ